MRGHTKFEELKGQRVARISSLQKTGRRAKLKDFADLFVEVAWGVVGRANRDRANLSVTESFKEVNAISLTLPDDLLDPRDISTHRQSNSYFIVHDVDTSIVMLNDRGRLGGDGALSFAKIADRLDIPKKPATVVLFLANDERDLAEMRRELELDQALLSYGDNIIRKIVLASELSAVFHNREWAISDAA